jgi:hypothetical protein
MSLDGNQIRPDGVLKKSGGPLEGQSQTFSLTLEVAEIISYRYEKPYEDVSFLINLYLKKGWNLRRISKELHCCQATVRKKLLEAGIELVDQGRDEHVTLKKKILAWRERGLSYEAIANAFNLWKIATRTG